MVRSVNSWQGLETPNRLLSRTVKSKPAASLSMGRGVPSWLMRTKEEHNKMWGVNDEAVTTLGGMRAGDDAAVYF